MRSAEMTCIDWCRVPVAAPPESPTETTEKRLLPRFLRPHAGSIRVAKAPLTVIYSFIPGAVLGQDSTSIPLVQFSTTTDVWLGPCTAQVNVVAAFACVPPFPFFPSPVYFVLNSYVDPLVSGGQIFTSPEGTHNFTVCVNAFTDIGTIAGARRRGCVLSFIPGDRLGDSFLRNVSTAFDFGIDSLSKGTPLVQMLSTTDGNKRAADYIAVRAAAMAGMPPELAPADLIKVFAGTLNTTDAVPVTISAPSSTPAVNAPATASSANGKPNSASRMGMGSSGVALLLAAVVGVAVYRSMIEIWDEASGRAHGYGIANTSINMTVGMVPQH
ncbi:hypothetical protein K438DRAFT_2019907 [Mycena galopus ATCC 62051]|nr:hypothetical protein K438DRAFT_2019907 [Mycena galopus ATCC 62051]